MAYQLREWDPATLEDMQKIAVSVEANLNDTRARLKAEKKVAIKEEASTLDQVIRKVEKMIEILTLDKLEPQIRNPNFRGQQQPQFRIKQWEQRAQELPTQQQVNTPLQQNFVGPESDDEDNVIGEENHFFTPDDMPTFITEDEEYAENSTEQKDEDFILANYTTLEEESDEYQRGYMNALSAHQRQYSLRNRDVPINPIQKIKEV